MKPLLLIFLVLSLPLPTTDPARYLSRKGFSQYLEREYGDAEVNFKRAIKKDNKIWETWFNLGNTLYRQDRFEEAAFHYSHLTNSDAPDALKSKAFFNSGNIYINLKNLPLSIEAYKQALRMDPGNMEAKYNLAFAQILSRDQNNEKENKPGGGGEKDKEDSDSAAEGGEADSANDGSQAGGTQPSQNPSESLSPEDIEQMRKALNEAEKSIHGKSNIHKVAGNKVQVDQDW